MDNDPHSMIDQLILMCALATGKSESEVQLQVGHDCDTLDSLTEGGKDGTTQG